MLLLFVADVVVDVVPAVVVVVIVFLLQLYSDKGIPLGEKIVHVRPTPPHPHLFFIYMIPCHMGSHMLSLEDLSPFLEGGCCYARNLL